MTNQNDKATERPLETTSNAQGTICEAGGGDIIADSLTQQTAERFIKAVNEHAALKAVELAAKNLALTTSPCPHCDATGYEPRTGNKDACHICGGHGNIASTPYAGDAQDLAKALSALAAIRGGGK